LHAELSHVDDINQLVIEGKHRTISYEWISEWWLKKPERGLPSEPIINIIGAGVYENEDLNCA